MDYKNQYEKNIIHFKNYDIYFMQIISKNRNCMKICILLLNYDISNIKIHISCNLFLLLFLHLKKSYNF